MTDNDHEKPQSETSDNPSEIGAAGKTAPSYHAPTLTSFGPLAKLVQINPAVGSDGGTGDCQHA